jgi:hypothetical protein
VDKIQADYFKTVFHSVLIINFAMSNQTETSTAGEQLVRDNLMFDKYVKRKGVFQKDAPF